MVLVSFLFFLLAFFLVGMSSHLKSHKSKEDYYLASKGISPLFTGLSAVATNNSGYMFIGVIGYTYAVGLSTVWMAFGWIFGDFLASLYIHKELRAYTETTRELSFAGVISRWTGEHYREVRFLAALISVIFLGSYAAAQLSAGGKALFAILDWPQVTGSIIVAVAVAGYCWAGGLRASIWTDVAQSAVMIVAMFTLMYFGVQGLGGFGGTLDRLSEVPGFLDLSPGADEVLFPGAMGIILFILGWMFAGLSVIGQPHIMVRFMSLDNPDHLVRTRVWYYGFFSLFYLMAVVVGMLSKIYLPGLDTSDPELALPMMAQDLLHPVFVGLVLAGIFAATMSTADSLVLSCSSALTHDLLPQRFERTWQVKSMSVLVTLFALGIAIAGPQSVFTLVVLSWGVLGSAFAPVLVIYTLGMKPSEAQTVMMMVIGVTVALVWRQLGLHTGVFEAMPGILAALAYVWLRKGMIRARQAHTEAAHTEAAEADQGAS
ncbi:sodium/proline symporter [Yunchengibacter salinarum]|uniref:sodium/proline symporter n=1 Tax=Yunchengibacter salinarum TaxID=3133399 RepID=UPI0035B5B6BF